jgi:predicted RNase H-like HicB family nuclease
MNRSASGAARPVTIIENKSFLGTTRCHPAVTTRERPLVDSEQVSMKKSRKRKNRMKLKVILEPSEDGGYTAIVPGLPGCISEGDTKEEALANIKEAIELYLEPVEDDLSARSGVEVVEMAV